MNAPDIRERSIDDNLFACDHMSVRIDVHVAFFLQRDQAGVSTSYEFASAIWNAAVVRYDVDLSNERVRTKGATANAKRIPLQD